jgi:hypothetical protein
VIIYYGTATEYWVRMKLFDLLKATGWGRRVPFRAKAVWVAEPATPPKTIFATDEAIVLDATGGFEPAILEPFLNRLAPAGAGR